MLLMMILNFLAVGRHDMGHGKRRGLWLREAEKNRITSCLHTRVLFIWKSQKGGKREGRAADEYGKRRRTDGTV